MKVYFFCCPPGPANNTAYEHQIVSIAEGLQQLGIECRGNINYWQQGANPRTHLIRKTTDNYQDFELVIFSSSMFVFHHLHLLPDDLFCKRRNYKLVFIDDADDLITPGFDKRVQGVDYVLKSHYNKKYTYPSNFFPWQFGLTKRIISYARPLPFNERKNSVISNFRVPHPVRALAEKEVMRIVDRHYEKDWEIDMFDDVSSMDDLSVNYWAATGRRHNPKFYERLGKSKVCFAFGGYFQKSIWFKKSFAAKVARRIDRKFNCWDYDVVYQFDSWRFWEALVSGCCTIHIDFEKYGAVLPVMPKNSQDYLGVNFCNLSDLKKSVQNPQVIENVGNSGRVWALQNYSPDKTAERLLNLVF